MRLSVRVRSRTSRVRRLSGIVHAEAMQGVSLGAGLLITAVALCVSLVASPAAFAPGWADPLNYVLTSTVYLGPLTLSAAASASSQLSRTGLLSLASTTPRGRRSVLTVSLAAAAGWSVVALLAEAVVIGLSAELDGPFSLPMALLPISAVGVLALSAASGVALGARYDAWLVAPAAGLGTFLVLWFLALADGQLAAFSPVFTSTFYQVPFEPHAALVLLQIGLGTSVLTAAVATFALTRRARGVLAVAAVGALASVVGLAVVNPTPVQYRSQPGSVLCASDGGVVVCVWPDSRRGLGPMLGALADAKAASGGLLSTPTRFSEEGIALSDGRVGRPSDPGVVVLPSQAGQEELRFRAVRALVPEPECSGGRAVDAWYDVIEWLTTRLDSAYIGREDVRAVTSSEPSEQRRWLDERVSRMRECTR